MTPGPTIVRQCYKCHGLFKQGTMASGNTFSAKFWPDGLMQAPMMLDTPRLMICPCCDDSIWLTSCKEVDQIDDYEEMQKKHLDVKFYKDPNIDIFILALEEKGLNKSRESYIRTKLMHFFNDENRDLEVPVSEPSNMQIENYKRLLVIADKDNGNDILLRAEIYRELGEFDKCLNLLEQFITRLPDDYVESAKHLIKLCKNKDSRVMEILT